MTTRRAVSELAGQTVRLKDSAAGVGGSAAVVEDWCVNVLGRSWATANGSPAAWEYAVRSSVPPELPIDDEVLYVKIGTLGYLVHVSEIETGAPS